MTSSGFLLVTARPCFHWEVFRVPKNGALKQIVVVKRFVTLMAKKYRVMQFELDMAFDTHWNYEGAHDYTWHMRIPLQSHRALPRYEIHIDSYIHSLRCWNMVPLVRCHTDTQLCSYFVSHGRIHNNQQMPLMYTVSADHCQEVILLFKRWCVFCGMITTSSLAIFSISY